VEHFDNGQQMKSMKTSEKLDWKNSCVFGVDLGGTKVQTGLVDFGVLKNVLNKEINNQDSAKDVLQEIFELLDQYSKKEISAIGIGIPSVVDVEAGIVYDVQNIRSWKEVHLKKILEERYQVPVFINNDANVFALGEKYFGCARSFQNLVGLTIGTGLGAGLIINGKLYSGRNCGAGEFGEVPYKESKLEDYCAGNFFLKQIGMSGKQAFLRAEQGDKDAKKIFEEFGYHLGNALKIIVLAVDPEIIVLGGSISQAFKYFEQTMMSQFRTLVFTKTVERLIVKISATKNVALLGAAALCFD
jgi:glucokinase